MANADPEILPQRLQEAICNAVTKPSLVPPLPLTLTLIRRSKLKSPKLIGFLGRSGWKREHLVLLKPGVQVEVTDNGGGSEAKGGSKKPVDETELEAQKEGGCDAAEGEGSLNLLQVVEKPVEEAQTNVRGL